MSRIGQSPVNFQENVEVIFHTAAYKHVPLVENNPLQGLFNNCISTRITCQASKKYGVEKLTIAQMGGLECGKCHY